MFPIDPSKMPSLRTRQALLCIDLQNDFLSPDGALPVSQPDGFVDRILQVVAAFRASGAGDVIWIRSEFAEDGPADAGQIVVCDLPQLPSRAAAHRGRPRLAPQLAPPPEADAEAFLSASPQPDEDDEAGARRPACVRPGSKGAELAPQVAAAVAPGDHRLTKTAYSAFETGQLLQLLRGRFATELYICGALTNASVYATALAAGSHGYDIKVLDDCCGYRSDMRHANATQQLVHLTGCEVLSAEEALQAWQPEPARPEPKKRESGGGGGGGGGGRAAAPGRRSPMRPSQANLPVRCKPAAPDSGEAGRRKRAEGGAAPAGKAASSPSTSLSPASPAVDPPDKTVSLNAASHTAASVEPVRPAPEDPPQPPAARRPVQPVVRSDDGGDERTRSASKPGAGAGGAQVRTRATEAREAEGQEDAPPRAPSGAPIGGSGDSRPSEEKGRRSQPKVVGEASNGHRQGGPAVGSVASDETRGGAEGEAKGIKEPAAPEPSTPPAQQPSRPERERSGTESREPEESKSPPKATPGASAPGGETRDPAMGGSPGEPCPGSDTAPASSEPLCEGDTTIIRNLLPPTLEAGIFDRLRGEVQWQTMSHQGGSVPRLVAVQGAVEADGTRPVYRHPSDEAPPLLPFSPAVLAVKREVERHLGHEVNHALLQLYRGGGDYISEHSDKTLDIAPGSFIANVSLGAERTMVFRTKRAWTGHDGGTPAAEAAPASSEAAPSGQQEEPPEAAPPPGPAAKPADDPLRRQVRRAALPHNSLCRMGLRTNARWLHAIRQDKRLARDKTPAELAFGGQRISLTFRRIGTFLSPAPAAAAVDGGGAAADDAQLLIWGQGAVGKTRAEARPVVNGQTPEAVRMLQAFGKENNASAVDWAGTYGAGFDVLHLRGAPPRFFGGGDAIVDGRVRALLAELGVKYARGGVAASRSHPEGRGQKQGGDEDADAVDGGRSMDIPVRFVDDDAARSTVTGGLAILLYLDAVHWQRARGGDRRAPAELARVYPRVQQALALEDKWRGLRGSLPKPVAGPGADAKQCGPRDGVVRALRKDLAAWDACVAGGQSKRAAHAAGDAGPRQAYIAGGDGPSIADFALWPVLHDMAGAHAEGAAERVEERDAGASFREALERNGLAGLAAWYDGFGRRAAIRAAFGAGGPGDDGESAER